MSEAEPSTQEWDQEWGFEHRKFEDEKNEDVPVPDLGLSLRQRLVAALMADNPMPPSGANPVSVKRAPLKLKTQEKAKARGKKAVVKTVKGKKVAKKIVKKR